MVHLFAREAEKSKTDKTCMKNLKDYPECLNIQCKEGK